jgi:hypothetical protein
MSIDCILGSRKGGSNPYRSWRLAGRPFLKNAIPEPSFWLSCDVGHCPPSLNWVM